MDPEVLCSCDLCDSDRIDKIDAESNICRCLSCGYVFDNPRPTAKDVAAYYSKPTKYDSWVLEEGARDRLWKRRLGMMKKTRKPGSLLDVGTGIGQFLYHAKFHYSPVYGTEVSESAVEIAKEKYGLSVRHGDIMQLDFAEAPFDNITLFHVLEHVPSPRALIQRCREVLGPKGILVVAVPNDLHCLRAKVKILLKKLGLEKYKHLGKLGLAPITLDGKVQEIHVSHFTSDVLRRFLEKSGFSILEDGIDPYYAASGMSKLIQDMEHLVYHGILLVGGIHLNPALWIVGRRN